MQKSLTGVELLRRPFNFIVSSVIITILPLHIYFSEIDLELTNDEVGKETVSRGQYISSVQYNFDVIHYNLNIDLQHEKRILSGDVIITGKLKDKNIKTIEMNLYNNMVVSHIEVSGRNATFEHYQTTLRIHLPEKLPDTFAIRIRYSGTPKKLGFASFVFGKINEQPLIFSLNEPEFASTWFPCNDIPSDKALADISITADSSLVSVSNGKLVSVQTNGNKKTYSWNISYPISTYLISLYSSKYYNFNESYISITGDTIPLQYYVLPSHRDAAKKDFEDHPAMMRCFENLFGPYPFPKEKYGVAEFLWQNGAMEHQTISGIGTKFVTGNKYFNDILVHELAHHWWGNAVGPHSWRDIWLNEGFANYCEALYEEYYNGKEALHAKMASIYSPNFTGTLYDPEEDLFSTTVYDKGAWVVHMLRNELGDSVFFRTLRTYFERFKYSNASTSDFIKVCEEVSGKNLDWFFDQWVYTGDNVPHIEWRYQSTKRENDFLLTLTMKQVQYGFQDYILKIPVTFEYSSRKNWITKTVVMDATEKTFTFELKTNPHAVLPDYEGTLLAVFKDITPYEK